MDQPFLVKPGSKIGVCAPSARFDLDLFNQGIDVLKSMGFQVQVPDAILKRKRYLAGDDLSRAETINRLFRDSEISGVICARGGFGAMRTLPYLDWNSIRDNPKPFIGFSDSTAILLSIMTESGNSVVHGPTVVSLAHAQNETLDSFYTCLTGSAGKIDVTNGQVIYPGKCSGLLKGGNMSTISHLLGTRFQPDFYQAVVFLEDIGEPAYKIDRMLAQMKMAGLFDGMQGVVTGSFEKCDNDDYLEEILFEAFQEYQVPVLSGLASGHGKVNLSLRMGAKVEMDTHSATILWT